MATSGTPARETPGWAAATVAVAAAGLVTFVFGAVRDRWMGMTGAMGLLLAAAWLLPSVRRRIRPTPLRVVLGVLSAAGLFGATAAGVLLLRWAWPGWSDHAAEPYTWKAGHGPLFLAVTLVMIVFAEEAVWRGVVVRALLERRGRAAAILGGALIYALAHAASMNPVLLLAAVVLGIVWGWLYVATDDLTVPFLCHLGWDALLLFAVPLR